MIAVHEDIVPRAPTVREIAIAEAICIGLARLVEEDRTQLSDAWKAGQGFVTTMSVETHAGPVEITLAAPYDMSAPISGDTPLPVPIPRGPFDINAQVRNRDGSLDDRWFDVYSAELVHRFAASPEGLSVPDYIVWSEAMMWLGKDYHRVTVATMNAAEFKEILFELFPRKMSCEPDSATSIVSELRAFWNFLKREFGLKNADSCLAVLVEDAAKQLEQKLSNPANFGVASASGKQSWRGAHNVPEEHGQTPDIVPRATLSDAEKRAKRNKRKAQRASRTKKR